MNKKHFINNKHFLHRLKNLRYFELWGVLRKITPTNKMQRENTSTWVSNISSLLACCYLTFDLILYLSSSCSRRCRLFLLLALFISISGTKSNGFILPSFFHAVLIREHFLHVFHSVPLAIWLISASQHLDIHNQNPTTMAIDNPPICHFSIFHATRHSHCKDFCSYHNSWLRFVFSCQPYIKIVSPFLIETT